MLMKTGLFLFLLTVLQVFARYKNLEPDFIENKISHGLVQRIRIQSSTDAYRDYDGEQLYASEHGRATNSGQNSEELRWVYLRAISNSECRETYASGVYDSTICARYFNDTSQNTCFGDNGGPLVHVGSHGVPTLVGITYFFPTRGCESGWPTGYTRPGPFLPWLEEVTGIDYENLQEDDEEDSESNEDEDLAQLLKRLQVDVKVRVRLDKYNVTKEVGNEINVRKI